jgi:hypothetical protein
MLSAQSARFLDGCSCSAPHLFQVELVRTAQAGDDDAPGRDHAARVQDGDLSFFAPQVAAGNQLADRPVQRAIDGARRAAGHGYPFKQVDDDRIGIALLNATLPDAYLPLRLSFVVKLAARHQTG